MNAKQEAAMMKMLELIALVEDTFPKGQENDKVVSLLRFLYQKRVLQIDGEVQAGVPCQAVNIKCFLPEQLEFDERDQVVNKIKETKDFLALSKGWVVNADPAFPPKKMKTTQIRFEVRFDGAMPGWAPRKWRADYEHFILNTYPKILKNQGLERAEEEREALARETGIDTYMKSRKTHQLVDSVDFSTDMPDLPDLLEAFGTLVSRGNPTESAVSRLRAAARRRGCSEAKINRALDMYSGMTGNILRGPDNNSSNPSQGEARS